MMYDYDTLEKMLGVPKRRFSNIIGRYGIPKTIAGRKPFIDDTGVEEIKKHLTKFTPECRMKGCRNYVAMHGTSNGGRPVKNL